jgi:hypothetical protein
MGDASCEVHCHAGRAPASVEPFPCVAKALDHDGLPMMFQKASVTSAGNGDVSQLKMDGAFTAR